MEPNRLQRPLSWRHLKVVLEVSVDLGRIVPLSFDGEGDVADEVREGWELDLLSSIDSDLIIDEPDHSLEKKRSSRSKLAPNIAREKQKEERPTRIHLLEHRPRRKRRCDLAEGKAGQAAGGSVDASSDDGVPAGKKIQSVGERRGQNGRRRTSGSQRTSGTLPS